MVSSVLRMIIMSGLCESASAATGHAHRGTGRAMPWTTGEVCRERGRDAEPCRADRRIGGETVASLSSSEAG